MKSRDFLDILGDIDMDMVDDAAPVKCKKEKVYKKRISLRMKVVAVAACCVLAVGGVFMLGFALGMVNPDTVIPRPDTDTDVIWQSEADKTEETLGDSTEGEHDNWTGDNGSSAEDAYGNSTEDTGNHETDFEFNDGTHGYIDSEMESIWDGESEMANPFYSLNPVLEDERFSTYRLSGTYCPIEMVGEKVADVKIRVDCQKHSPGEKCYLNAEIYNVLGTGNGFYLCYKYVSTTADCDFYVDYNSYSYMGLKEYCFPTLLDMKKTVFDNEQHEFSEYIEYQMCTDDDYCKNLWVRDSALDYLIQLIFATNGESVQIEGGQFDIENFNERISLSFHSYGCGLYGGLYVLDSGYLCFDHTVMGQMVFFIGENAAYEIIDFVKHEGDTKDYIWNSETGKWYHLEFRDVTKYPTLKETLDKNNLVGNIVIGREVQYWANKYDTYYPDVLLIDKKMRATVSDLLYNTDGEAVEIEDIINVAHEGMTFVCSNYTNGVSCRFTLYDSGHICFNGDFYFVGTEFTDNIMSTIRNNCTTYYKNASYFRWNEEEQWWETYSPEWYETETEIATEESIDEIIEESECPTECETEWRYEYESTDIEREAETERVTQSEWETESFHEIQ